MKAKANTTRTYVIRASQGKSQNAKISDWEAALKTLIDALDSCYTKTGSIRKSLEKVTSDMAKLKGVIDGMVNAAVVAVDK